MLTYTKKHAHTHLMIFIIFHIPYILKRTTFQNLGRPTTLVSTLDKRTVARRLCLHVRPVPGACLSKRGTTRNGLRGSIRTSHSPVKWTRPRRARGPGLVSDDAAGQWLAVQSITADRGSWIAAGAVPFLCIEITLVSTLDTGFQQIR